MLLANSAYAFLFVICWFSVVVWGRFWRKDYVVKEI